MRECQNLKELGEEVNEDELPFGGFMRISNKINGNRSDRGRG